MQARGVDGKRLEVREELPARLPYHRRAVARHLVLGKDVEFRILAEGASPVQLEAFKRELVLLSVLDLPGLAPVLDRGVHEGRFHYAVPLRQHPWLETLVAAEDCRLEERWAVVQSLARVVAGFHVREQTLGPLLPEMIGWDRLGSQVCLQFFPEPREAASTSALPPLPPHLTRGFESPLALDVLHWAWLSAWFLSRGKVVCGPRQEVPASLGQLAPEVPESLREVLDACLGCRPERPGNGVELALVQRGQLGEMLGFVARNLRAEDSGDLATSIANVRSELSRSGSKPYLGSGEELDPLRMTSLEQTLEKIGITAGKSPTGRKLTLILLVLGVLVGGLLLPREGRPSRPPGPGNPESSPRNSPSSSGYRHANERFVVDLMKLEPVTKETFPKAFQMLRNLSVRGKLPEGLGSFEQLRKLEGAFEEDSQQGCEKMNALLGALRRAVKASAQPSGG